MRETDFHEHVASERGDLFECHDGGSTELEYLDLIWAFVRVYKPKLILETGALRGFGTVSLARACQANKMGRVVSVEMMHNYVEETQVRLQQAGLTQYATLIEANTMDFLAETDFQFGFAFFDSDLKLRCKEYELCFDRGLVQPGALVAFHDTSATRVQHGRPDPESKIFWDDFEKLKAIGKIKQHVVFPYSRGLVVAKVP